MKESLSYNDITDTPSAITVASGAEVDTGTDNVKMVTPKAMEDSSYSKLALGETSATAYRGDRGKTAYDHSQAAHAPSDADNTLNYLLGRDPQTIEDSGNIVFHFEGGIFTVLLSDFKKTLKDYFDTIYTPL
jgi:hypothetical protein